MDITVRFKKEELKYIADVIERDITFRNGIKDTKHLKGLIDILMKIDNLLKKKNEEERS